MPARVACAARDPEIRAASGCTFTWTFAATPKRGLGTVMRAGRPLNDAFFNSFATDTRKHFGAA